MLIYQGAGEESAGTETTAPDRHAELLSRALRYVDAHLAERLDATTLADHAAMSRHHFHRIFQARVGCSVGRYVVWCRLQRACALLQSGREPVLDIALAVGYESAQALNKAMRREIDTTPLAVRRHGTPPWPASFQPQRIHASIPFSPKGISMTPQRFDHLPAGLVALTATAKGMVDRTMVRAAKQAFGELTVASMATAEGRERATYLAFAPDDAQGPDDPHCRYVAAVVFGYNMSTGEGRCLQPDIVLTGSLAWQPIDAGRCAVFLHQGPYDTLFQSWNAIYKDWLPCSREKPRDSAPMERMMNDPRHTAPADLLTEIWIPVV